MVIFVYRLGSDLDPIWARFLADYFFCHDYWDFANFSWTNFSYIARLVGNGSEHADNG